MINRGEDEKCDMWNVEYSNVAVIMNVCKCLMLA